MFTRKVNLTDVGIGDKGKVVVGIGECEGIMGETGKLRLVLVVSDDCAYEPTENAVITNARMVESNIVEAPSL